MTHNFFIANIILRSANTTETKQAGLIFNLFVTPSSFDRLCFNSRADRSTALSQLFARRIPRYPGRTWRFSLSRALSMCREFIRWAISTITAPRVSSRHYFSSLILPYFFHPSRWNVKMCSLFATRLGSWHSLSCLFRAIMKSNSIVVR